jgi:hypothetical protein
MYNGDNIHDHIRSFDELVAQLKKFQFINKRYVSQLFLATLSKTPNWLTFTTSLDNQYEKDSKQQLNLEKVKSLAIHHGLKLTDWNDPQDRMENAFYTVKPLLSTPSASPSQSSTFSALSLHTTSDVKVCNYYKGKGYTEDRCFSKFPHLFKQFKKRLCHRGKKEDEETTNAISVLVFVSIFLSAATSLKAEWFLDSATSLHITAYYDHFFSYQLCDSFSIHGRDNSILSWVVDKGNIVFTFTSESESY